MFAGSLEDLYGGAWAVRHLIEFALQNNLPFLTINFGSRDSFKRCGEVQELTLDRSRVTHHSFQIRQGLCQFRPDVVHVAGPSAAGLLGLYAARRFGLPVVASWRPGTGNRLTRYFVSRFYSLATVVLAANEDTVPEMHDQTAKRVFLIPRGVDTSLFSPHKRMYADGVARIGFAGPLEAEAHVRFLAELERSLGQQVSRRFRFLIVGDGNGRHWLERNLNSAEFTGLLEGEALSRAYARMDVFASAPAANAKSSAILEVMASGVPAVVAAESPDRFFIEHGCSGFVGSNRAELAAHVASLLKNRELRRRMALASSTSARQWSWEGVCEAIYRA
jgi:glycosyltransferase involved in cell wall biosynthesis